MFAGEERRNYRFKHSLYTFPLIKVKHCEFRLTVGKRTLSITPVGMVAYVRFFGTTFLNIAVNDKKKGLTTYINVSVLYV